MVVKQLFVLLLFFVRFVFFWLRYSQSPHDASHKGVFVGCEYLPCSLCIFYYLKKKKVRTRVFAQTIFYQKTSEKHQWIKGKGPQHRKLSISWITSTKRKKSQNNYWTEVWFTFHHYKKCWSLYSSLFDSADAKSLFLSSSYPLSTFEE